MENVQRSAMSIKKFCEDFNVSETTPYQQIALGQLRAVKVGRKTFIPEVSAKEWLKGLPQLESTTGLNVSQNIAAEHLKRQQCSEG